MIPLACATLKQSRHPFLGRQPHPYGDLPNSANGNDLPIGFTGIRCALVFRSRHDVLGVSHPADHAEGKAFRI